MKEFEKIGKKMPFTESDAYIDGLINQSIERATSSPKKNTRKLPIIVWSTISSAAAALIVLFSVMNYQSYETYMEIQNSDSLSEVLSTLSDDQISNLQPITLDDIPEY